MLLPPSAKPTFAPAAMFPFVQNDLMELWSLMHFLMPAVFASHAQVGTPVWTASFDHNQTPKWIPRPSSWRMSISNLLMGVV